MSGKFEFYRSFLFLFYRENIKAIKFWGKYLSYYLYFLFFFMKIIIDFFV
jgi:hypothetical protein